MPKIPFKQVDVFTNTCFKGSPVAVILHAEMLSAEDMQQIATWMNLSETTFVLPATDQAADYRVRIFTPKAELPFAGHPTIGTAHALLEAGLIEARDGSLVQQCAAGLIKLQVTQADDGAQWIAFEVTNPLISAIDDSQRIELESLLGCTVVPNHAPCVVDVGPRWLVAQLQNAEAVLKLQPDMLRMQVQDAKHGNTGVIVFGEYTPGAASQIEVRAFAPIHGINEDPVCGSGNACIAAYIRDTGQTDHFGRKILASQGAVLSRAGKLRLGIYEDRIEVAGNAITCIDGSVAL